MSAILLEGQTYIEPLTEDQKALVASVAPLMFNLATKESFKPGVDRDDAHDQAITAMMRAAMTYDPTKGFKFTTYASFTFFMRMGVRQRRGRQITRRPYRLMPMLVDESADAASENPCDLSAANEILEIVNKAVEAIRSHDPRMAYVIELRCQGLTYAQIAPRLDLSRERVSQIYSDAVVRLRTLIAAEYLSLLPVVNPRVRGVRKGRKEANHDQPETGDGGGDG